MSGSSDISIRRFSEADAADVRALFVTVNRALAPPDLSDTFEDYIQRSLDEEIDRIEDYYAERSGSFWVALDRSGEPAGDEGRLVGMFGLEAIGPGAVELRRMYVALDARRRGIARRMLMYAEDVCRTEGAAALYLSTSELQQQALSLYRNAGYRQVREEVADAASNKTVGGGIRRYHFVKTLGVDETGGQNPA